MTGALRAPRWHVWVSGSLLSLAMKPGPLREELAKQFHPGLLSCSPQTYSKPCLFRAQLGAVNCAREEQNPKALDQRVADLINVNIFAQEAGKCYAASSRRVPEQDVLVCIEELSKQSSVFLDELEVAPHQLVPGTDPHQRQDLA